MSRIGQQGDLGRMMLTAAGVVLFTVVAARFSALTVVADLFALRGSYFFSHFEQHFWQYLYSFLAVVMLSRGHLWSYGINSQNLGLSMKWLAGLYVVVIVVSLFFPEYVVVEGDHVPRQNADIIFGFLVYWMSSPVANQILFFSFGQTVLMKQWNHPPTVFGLPLPVLFSALLFTAASNTSRFDGGAVAFVPTFLLGMFCGVVYWKTNSLITPMLGHAFYFGFPLFIESIRTVPAP